MGATKGTGIEKELLPSTASATDTINSFFDISYYYTATMKRKITRYVLYGGLE
jgi:hypothetical protein